MENMAPGSIERQIPQLVSRPQGLDDLVEGHLAHAPSMQPSMQLAHLHRCPPVLPRLQVEVRLEPCRLRAQQQVAVDALVDAAQAQPGQAAAACANG